MTEQEIKARKAERRKFRKKLIKMQNASARNIKINVLEAEVVKAQENA